MRAGIAHASVVPRDAIGHDVLGMYDILVESGFSVDLIGEYFESSIPETCRKLTVEEAIAVLSRANANILGTVLTRMEGQRGGYYYGQYYVPVSDNSRTASSNGNGASTASLPSGVSGASDEHGLAGVR